MGVRERRLLRPKNVKKVLMLQECAAILSLGDYHTSLYRYVR